MKTISFKLPTIDEVDFDIEYLPEHIQIWGNASAIDEETDREVENDIIDQLGRGNEWAWCAVKVTAKYKDQEGVDYLGGCSYASEKDFMTDGYYQDMKQQAYNDLLQNLESLND